MITGFPPLLIGFLIHSDSWIDLDTGLVSEDYC